MVGMAGEAGGVGMVGMAGMVSVSPCALDGWRGGGFRARGPGAERGRGFGAWHVILVAIDKITGLTAERILFHDMAGSPTTAGVVLAKP